MTEQITVLIDTFLQAQNWVEAKTCRQTAPHEYIVKKDCPDPLEFEWFVLLIRSLGFTASFAGREYLYFIRGDYYYWTMGAPIEETVILNRAHLSDYSLVNRVWHT